MCTHTQLLERVAESGRALLPSLYRMVKNVSGVLNPDTLTHGLPAVRGTNKYRSGAGA